MDKMTETARLETAERKGNDHSPTPTDRTLAEQQEQNSKFDHMFQELNEMRVAGNIGV
jgi:hypothetical protein